MASHTPMISVTASAPRRDIMICFVFLVIFMAFLHYRLRCCGSVVCVYFCTDYAVLRLAYIFLYGLCGSKGSHIDFCSWLSHFYVSSKVPFTH